MNVVAGFSCAGGVCILTSGFFVIVIPRIVSFCIVGFVHVSVENPCSRHCGSSSVSGGCCT